MARKVGNPWTERHAEEVLLKGHKNRINLCFKETIMQHEVL